MSRHLFRILGAMLLSLSVTGVALAQDSATTQTKTAVAQTADSSWTVVEYPVGKEVTVNLTPTAGFPNAIGVARITRDISLTKISLDLLGMTGNITTFNLYAVDETGKATALGPISVKKGVGALNTTTPLNRFMLVLSPDAGLTAIAPKNTVVLRSAVPEGFAVMPLASKGESNSAAVGEKVSAVSTPAATVDEKVAAVPTPAVPVDEMVAVVPTPAATVEEKVAAVPTPAATVDEKVAAVSPSAATVDEKVVTVPTPAVTVEEKVAAVPTAAGPTLAVAGGEKVAAVSTPVAKPAYSAPLLGIPSFKRGTDTELKIEFEDALAGSRANVSIKPQEVGATTITMRFHELKNAPAGKAYVVWAVSPDNKLQRLGQIVNTSQRNEAQVQSETQFVDFGLFVTLEDESSNAAESPTGVVIGAINK